VKRDGGKEKMRYLITVADDFGISPSVNRAVADACDRGILTAASIMAGGDAFDEAVQIAIERPNLSVGLHTTLCDGRAVLPHSCIPGLTDLEGFFENSPAKAWLRYTRPGLRLQIEMEIDAQFRHLENAGIHPSHVDCHHHLHMHPFVLEALCRQASRRGIRWVRMPCESLFVVLRTRSPFRGVMPFLEWAAFGALGPCNMRIIRRNRMSVAGHVYGLSRTGGIDEQYLLDILDRAAAPNTEIFFHPDAGTEAGRRELAALTAPAVRHRLAALDISLTGYGVLSGAGEFVWEGS
jgi:hopanoid biosynthesis associated protein HpnK